MLYGYIDESGTEDTAEYLVVSVMIFDSEAKTETLSNRLTELRKELNFGKSYEFHRAHNSSETRRVVEKVLKSSDFLYFTVTARKRDNVKGSYRKIAITTIRELTRLSNQAIIGIDENPLLYQLLREEKKKRNLKGYKIWQDDSENDQLLQAVDYVVGIMAQNINYRASLFRYGKLLDKSLGIHILD